VSGFQGHRRAGREILLQEITPSACIGGIALGLGSGAGLAFAFHPAAGDLGIDRRIEHRPLLILEAVCRWRIQPLHHQGAVVLQAH
jgi:hypothetical protein